MSYHGLGDDQSTPALPSVSYGFDLPSSAMAEARTLQPDPFVAQDLPWGAGQESARVSAESRRQRTTHRLSDHGQPWLLIGSTSTQMNALASTLRKIGLLADDERPLRATGGHNQKFYEHEGLAAATIRAWNRFGREHAWNIKNLTDNIEAGWTWDHGRFLRVHPNMWDLIRRAGRGDVRPWVGGRNQRGFVYLKGGVYPTRDLLIDRIAKRLQNAGYMRPTERVFTSSGHWEGGDGGPFIRALRNGLWVEAGSNNTYWPSGFNFGPTDSDNLRIHPRLLDHLNNNMLLGERRKMNQKMLVRVVGPVRGGFPKV